MPFALRHYVNRPTPVSNAGSGDSNYISNLVEVSLKMMESLQLNGVIQGLLLLMLPLVSCGITCTSRYYCATKEIKFISMEEVPNAYLNTTAIMTRAVTNVSQCQQFCVNENKCQSINLKVKNTKGYDCHLLEWNKYSNSSRLVRDEAFTHLYIPSKCDQNPCRNDGVCVPVYSNDSYICECKSNGSWISRGSHCQTVLSGYMSAFIYYSFNDKVKNIPFNSDNKDMSSYTVWWNGAWVTDWKSPVVFCKRGGANCLQVWNGLPCFNSFSNCKSSTVTYSIWLKFGKSQVGKSANIFQGYHGSQTGLKFSYSGGKGYYLYGSISTSKRWDIVDFGTKIDQGKWNHFTFVFDDSTMACAYINGMKDKCQTVPTSVSYSIASNTAVRIGGAWYAGSEPEMYFDDFGIWKVALTPNDVMTVYNESKG